MMGDPLLNSGGLAVGLVLDGRFKILETIKEAGTSRVLKAEDLASGGTVALKIPKDVFARDAEFLERFRREEELGLKGLHPSLIRMIPVEKESKPYLVMEFVQGGTLAERLGEGGRFHPADAARLGGEILDGLAALHREGIVHRDVTPNNILMGTPARLADFGAAAWPGDPESSDWTWGTPAYMTPEQVEGRKGDARTDLYALGLVLYEALTGTLPFTGEDPVDLMRARCTEAPIAPSVYRPDLSPALEDVILRALRKNPAERFASAEEMKRELERAARTPGGRWAPLLAKAS